MKDDFNITKNHRTFFQRLVLLTPMMSVALIISIPFFHNLEDNTIVTQERNGLRIFFSLGTLIENLHQHRLLCNSRDKTVSYKENSCAAISAKITNTLKDIEIDAKSIPSQTQVTPALYQDISILHSTWETIATNKKQFDPEYFESLHAKIHVKLEALVDHIAERSNLILDPEIVIYSLIRLSTRDVLAMNDAISHSMNAIPIKIYFNNNTPTPPGKLKGHLEQLRGRVDHSLMEFKIQNATGPLNLATIAEQAYTDTAAYINKLSDSTPYIHYKNINTLLSLALTAHKSNLALYYSGLNSLDKLLALRAERIDNVQNLLILSFFSFELFAIYIYSRFKSEINSLRANRAQLNAIFNSALVGIITIDEKGNILNANSEALKIFGYTENDVLGNNVNMLMPHSIQTAHNTYLENYIASGDNKILGRYREEIALRKDKTNFPMELMVNTAKIDKKQLFVASIRDLSHEKSIEAVTRTQQLQIKTINIAQSSFIKGEHHIESFMHLNSSLQALTESQYSYIGEVAYDSNKQPFLRILSITNVSWDDKSIELYLKHALSSFELHNLNNLLGRSIISGATYCCNDVRNDPFSGGTPLGHPTLTTFMSVPLYTGSRMVGVIGLANRAGGYSTAIIDAIQPILSTCAQLIDALIVGRDSANTTNELKRAMNLMSSMFANLWAGIVVEDEERKILTVNQAYCNLFHIVSPPTALEGKSGKVEMSRVKEHFSDHLAFQELVDSCLKGYVTIVNKEIRLKDGRIFELEYIPVFTELENGNIQRTHLWSYRDATARKRSESELLDKARAAEAADRVKTQFLATMSHEIRTPMNGVLGMLQLLNKTHLDEIQKHYVDAALGSGKMLLTVLNDVLDFSKMEAGKLELEVIPFNPLTLAEDSAALMARAAEEKGLELICAVAPDMPNLVLGDPTRLRQVITNLLSNAIKFTESGDVVLYVTILDSERISFGVRDTGMGIPFESQQKLFSAFTQIDSSHTRKFGGTGLGLAISQHIVKSMGGKLHVFSAPGVGSDFSFDLVLPRLEETSPAFPFSSSLSRQRILLVQPSATYRAFIVSILINWKIEKIDQAASIVEATTLLNNSIATDNYYNIALIDHNIGESHVLSFSKLLQTADSKNVPHIIVFSQLEQRTMCSDVHTWISKPIRQQEFYSTLVKCAGGDLPHQVEITNDNLDEEIWFGSYHILLVEDNIINQEVANEILAGAGFIVDIRENGRDAIDAVKATKYDAVLMDIQMPELDGLEATREIRRLGGRFTKLPIFAMTAHAMGEDIKRSYDAGMNGHLTKPISPQPLFEELKRFLSPRSRTVDTSPTHSIISSRIKMPILPGVDYIEGLQRVRGNQTKFNRILKSFHFRHISTADNLVALLKSGHWEDAMHLAHTLKGNGGNIGAQKVYIYAAQVENSCREKDFETANKNIVALKDSLNEVLNGILTLQSDSFFFDKEPTSQEVNEPAIIALLDKLAPALNRDFIEAEHWSAALQRLAAGTKFSTFTDELANALHKFEPDAALDVILKLRALLK
ncbi:MAG: response regulator [Gammaproteobacteria bacterium]|nr:response regulator [Gammaproteobacteria bacterium]